MQNNEDKDRIANLGELATVLAHEMKNPMNSIIINLEVLRKLFPEDHPAAQKAQRYVDVIEGEVRRLDKVLRSFLDFASPPQTTKVKFKINPVIKIIADFISQEFKTKNVDLKLDLDLTIAEIIGSADQFKQVLLNLLLNALQAMPPEGGMVTVRTRPTDTGGVLIEVADTGKGIDPQVLPRIYDPYFTTKTRGSGLGLTLVKRFMKDHCGDVQVRSELGKGTTFTLILKGAAHI